MKVPIVQALKNDPNPKSGSDVKGGCRWLEETDFEDKAGQKLLSTHNLILIKKPRKYANTNHKRGN